MSAATAAATKRWRQRHPEQNTAYFAVYNKSEAHKAVKRRHTAKLKLEVLTNCSPNKVLGCSWEGCAVTDLDMLSLDHVKNDGAEHRREHGQNGIYVLARKLGYPKDVFQTLCMNHQWKKRLMHHRGETV